jgi:hypothetical protein
MCRQPAFGDFFSYTFPPGVILQLISIYFADIEILCFRM